MKVSIICTNYNKGDWVREAIDSFLNQETNFDFEIIIIDDASTDHSYEIIQEYQNKFPEKVRTFRNEVNLGITKTWKKICREAKGQYIARCDSDDFWTDPLKLQKQVDLLDASSDSLWSNTEFDMVDLDGNLIQKDAFANKALPLIDSYEEMLVMKGFTGRQIDEMIMRFRKEKLKKINLKAVLTDTNQTWDSMPLYENLRDEHEEMSGQ